MSGGNGEPSERIEPGRRGPLPGRRGLILFGTVGLALLVMVGVLVGFDSGDSSDTDEPRVEDRVVTVRSGPDNDQPVDLDTRFYLPPEAGRASRVPAILLAHGFGGTKTSTAEHAKELAEDGYAVLTWTARGFGRSGGRIHLNSPDYEVKDARGLVDWLAKRPEIRRDGAGDPAVAAMGSSYGGALSLLLAAYDDRVDVTVPQITWNDLERSLFPDATRNRDGAGVFKRGWANVLFSIGVAADTKPARLSNHGTRGPLAIGERRTARSGKGRSRAGAGSAPESEPRSAPGRHSGVRNPACGRFAADICTAYERAATSGLPDEELSRLLHRSSPSSVIDRIDAPTLLVQGLGDTLFTPEEADANAAGIGRDGTPVKVEWFAGGHDAGIGSESEQERLKESVSGWLDHYLRHRGPKPDESFTYSRVTSSSTDENGDQRLSTISFTAPRYPGLGGNRGPVRVRLNGGPATIANPPGGTPAAITSVPGKGAVGSVLDQSAQQDKLQRLPGQTVGFDTVPLLQPRSLAGSARVRLRVASPTGEAVLFVRMYDVDPNGSAELVGDQVAPIRLRGLPRSYDATKPIAVTLPPMVHRFSKDNRIRIGVSTTDQAYAGPTEPATYTVGLGAPKVAVPIVRTEARVASHSGWFWLLGGLLGFIVVGGVGVWLWARRRTRRREHTVVTEYADTPLVAQGLAKRYRRGELAVKSIDLTVRRGEVVGLLGPNGAGKTTTLRMLLGLTRPSAGGLWVFGHRVAPGAPVLSRLGAFVEGPGLLPHLTGQANLELYWKATGRPWYDARFDDVVRIAGLGPAIERRVATYSQGMRQRLAIAQAMLGLPDLLVLDEPTNGLDPPQIAEMRRVLHDYAADGRAVLVSSHLLAEVEQTCTHVVVMHHGEGVAAGPVRDVAGHTSSVLLDVTEVDRAERFLREMPGIRAVDRDEDTLVVDLNGTPRPALVSALVEAGIGVERMESRRRLEEAFLTLVSDDSGGAR